MPFIDWKCSECGREIRVDGSLESCYCNVCGKKIPVASSATANYVTSARGLIDWECPKCGRAIRVDASLQRCYCNACGKKISVAPKSADAETYRKAVAIMKRASSAKEYRSAAKLFYGILSYGDSRQMLNICLRNARDIESSQREQSIKSASGRDRKRTSSNQSSSSRRSGSTAGSSTRSSASAATESMGGAKSSAWTEGKCPFCGNDIYVDANKERFSCPKCRKDAFTESALSYKARSSRPASSSSSQPPEPSPAPKTNVPSNRPSTGKAVGFGFLCYAVIASIMAFTSIFAFQAMGYAAYIGPNLISLAVGVFFGIVYKTTGKASSLVVFSVLIGVALGFVLPYFAISMH